MNVTGKLDRALPTSSQKKNWQRIPPDSHYFPSLAHTVENEYIVRKLNMLLV